VGRKGQRLWAESEIVKGGEERGEKGFSLGRDLKKLRKLVSEPTGKREAFEGPEGDRSGRSRLRWRTEEGRKGVWAIVGTGGENGEGDPWS